MDLTISKKTKSDHRPAVSASASSSTSDSLFDALSSYIILDILLRLPIRAVMAARCVCKTWFALTSDDHFAKLHSIRAPTELLVRPQKLMNGVTTDLILGDLCSRHTSGSKFHFKYVFQLPRFTVKFNNEVCFKDTTESLRLVGSCHGLLCYSAYHDVEHCFAVIWNPIMGQFLTVAPPVISPYWWIESFCYGFGFSPVAKRFKLLRMFQACNKKKESKNVAEVLTLEEGSFSWRNVDDCPYLVTEKTPGIFVESVFHWLVDDDKKIVDTYLYSFDFDREQFGQVLLPWPFVRNGKSKRVNFDLKVGVLEGSLAIIDYTYNICVDVWVMKEYGVRDSWVKAFSIEEQPVDFIRQYNFDLIKHLDNGEVLMMKWGRFLVAYDPAKKSIRTLGHGRDCDLQAIAYRPSLFPLQDVMTGYDVHAIDLCLRPIGLAIREKEVADDCPDWWDYWWVDAERYTKYLKEKGVARPVIEQQLIVAMFSKTTFIDDCEGEICVPARREFEGCLSPDTMKRNVMESLKDELSKEESSEQNEFAKGFQRKQSRIEHLQELIKQIEKIK